MSENPMETEGPFSVQVAGPFLPEHRLIIGGYHVPYVTVHPLPGSDTNYSLCVDGRYGLDCTLDELQRWAPILANGMAVAAGYSSHGENCMPLNPFKVQMMRLDEGL